MTDAAIDGRVRRGTWRRVLPRVLLTDRRRLDDDDRAMAALLFAGPAGVVTAHGAATRCGVRHVPRTDTITVLVPAGSATRSHAWVRIVETRRPVVPLRTTGGLRIAPVARAVVDTALVMRNLDTIRAIVADVAQRGLCDVAALAHELEHGPRRGSALLRAALAEVSRGARSAPEARLLTALRVAGVDAPVCNARIVVAGRCVAVADLWWPALRLVVEIDSREWHLSPRDWERTMRRHNQLQALGFTVLHSPPSRIARELDAVVAEIATTAAYLSAVAR
jgi:very-short-patch-repair endonuclease